MCWWRSYANGSSWRRLSTHCCRSFQWQYSKRSRSKLRSLARPTDSKTHKTITNWICSISNRTVVLTGIEGGGDLLLADTWQREREDGIVVVGGHGGFCPGVESGVSTQSLRDSRQLYHARQRIPAMR